MDNSEFFHGMFRISEQDIDLVELQIGKKTINQLRHERGLELVGGGDMPYTDWLREMMGYKIPTVH